MKVLYTYELGVAIGHKITDIYQGWPCPQAVYSVLFDLNLLPTGSKQGGYDDAGPPVHAACADLLARANADDDAADRVTANNARKLGMMHASTAYSVATLTGGDASDHLATAKACMDTATT